MKTFKKNPTKKRYVLVLSTAPKKNKSILAYTMYITQCIACNYIKYERIINSAYSATDFW